MRGPSAVAGVAAGAVVLAGAMAALAAGSGYTVKLNAADQAAARAMVIRRGDMLPAGGWQGGPTKPDLSVPTCANYAPKMSDLVIVGAAETDWHRADRSIGGDAFIFQTPRMVQLDWQRSVSAVGVECLLTREHAVNVSAARIPLPKLAPRVAAYRAFFDTTTPSGKTERWTLELAAVARGRTEISEGELMRAPAPLALLHADVIRLARIMLSRAPA
jgi:hypothetical protein